MTQDDIERAFLAAIDDGAETPKEIARFVSLWLFPMVHVDAMETRADGNLSFKVTVAQPTGSPH